MVQAFGVYLAHYLEYSTFPGASELDYAFIGGLAISQLTFIAPAVTSFSRRFGTRNCLLLGTVLQTAALLGASFARQVWQLFLSQGLLFGWGACFLYVGSTHIIPQWFTKRRSFANSIASSGSGVGGLMWSLAVGAIIRDLGVSWSFRITAICSFAVNGTCSFVMRDRNVEIDPTQRGFDLGILKKPQFVVLLGWSCFSVLAYTILVFSLPTYARSLGLSHSQAAIVGAMVNLGIAIGRPLFGFLSDKMGRFLVAGLATFACGMFSFLIWIFATNYGLLILFALLAGTVCGTFFVVS